MSSTSLVNLSSLIDDAKCYALVRQQRWPDGVRCPACGGARVIRHGRDDTQEERQRYRCNDCQARFDDLTGTVLAGHHRPLRVWVLCLYLMGLNLSNRQIAQELDLGVSDVHLVLPRLPHPAPGAAQGAWQGRPDPLCLAYCASLRNPPTSREVSQWPSIAATFVGW